MFREFLWQRFFMTGRVNDYLIIKETDDEDGGFDYKAPYAETAAAK